MNELDPNPSEAFAAACVLQEAVRKRIGVIFLALRAPGLSDDERDAFVIEQDELHTEHKQLALAISVLDEPKQTAIDLKSRLDMSRHIQSSLKDFKMFSDTDLPAEYWQYFEDDVKRKQLSVVESVRVFEQAIFGRGHATQWFQHNISNILSTPRVSVKRN